MLLLYNTLLINILWSNPPPNNRPYSSGKLVVKIVQIWPGILQSSNQIISRHRHDSNDLSAHKTPNLFYHIKVRDDWMISVAKYVFYRIQKVFWQCSDIIVGIHIFIENDQMTVHRHSGVFFSTAVLHSLTLPSQYARLNLDSLESKQGQLSGTVQLRVRVHHRRRWSRFSRLIRRMVEIEQSNLSAIYWAVRAASVNSITIFPSRSDNIVSVYDTIYCNRTMCLNKDETLFCSLIAVW